jgi:hypothetical protein
MKGFSAIFSSLDISSLNSKVFYFWAFFAPFMVRALPELLMGEYVTGFDTISYYAPVTWKWVNHGVSFWEFFGSAPLFYFLLSSLTLADIPLIASLKILPSILHGLLGLAILEYATKGLGWSTRKGLFASLLATLYFVGLRISWDMLRSELGLILLFAFLIILQKCLSEFNWKRFGFLSLSAVLVVMAHQLASLLMFIMVFAVALKKLMKRNYSFVGHLFMACLPAIALFTLTVYADYVVLPSYADDIAVSGRLEWLSLMGYSSIGDGIMFSVGFLLFCYIPLLPFALLGIRELNCLELKAWIIWCFVGSSLPFLFSSAPLSYRWILLLAFPLAFFAAEGYGKVHSSLFKKGLACFMALLSFSFVFLPAEAAFPYFNICPYYVPSSMLQNSVPLSDCEDVVRALNWVKDNNVCSSEILLVHDAFNGWALLYADGVKIVSYGYASPEKATISFSEQGYGPIYLIWWVSGEGWHGHVSLPLTFKEVFRSGRIAVYEFKTAV